MVSGYILFAIGLVVFFLKPKYVPLYYLLWATMVFVIALNAIFPMTTFEEATQVGHVHSTNFIWLCGIITIIKYCKKFDTNTTKIIFTLLCLFVFVFVIGTMRGTLIPFQGWLRTYFCFVPLWLIIKYNNISFKTYARYLVFALCVESVLVLFQTVIGLYPSYTNGEYAENGAVNIVGTFKRYNDFADNQSLLVLSLLYVFHKSRFIPHFLFYILIFVGLFLVLIAGARTELIALFVSLFILVWGMFPLWRKKIFVGGLIAVLFIMSGYNISLEKDTGSSADDSNYNRQRELLDFMEGDMDVAEESTFFLTAYLIGEYFSNPNKMLAGPGLLLTSSNGYHGVIMKDYLASDSFLALFLCETGIIGYLLLISFLILIVKNSKELLFPIAILVYLLIVSITDYGLFQGQSAIYLLFVVYYESSLEKKHKVSAFTVQNSSN